MKARDTLPGRSAAPRGGVAALSADSLTPFPSSCRCGHRPPAAVTFIVADGHPQTASELLARLIAAASWRAANPCGGQVLHPAANGPRLYVAVTAAPRSPRQRGCAGRRSLVGLHRGAEVDPGARIEKLPPLPCRGSSRSVALHRPQLAWGHGLRNPF
jgi:hypothetical protein